MARVAQAEGVNSHQVFQWRRVFNRGELLEADATTMALPPVTLSVPCGKADEIQEVGAKEGPPSSGSIHVELPGRVVISVECGADPVSLRSILESLRK